jgi:hypothetical protein
MTTRWRSFAYGRTEISDESICQVGIGITGWKRYSNKAWEEVMECFR